MRPKCTDTGLQIHDLWIMDSSFHIPESLVLTTVQSGTSEEVQCHIIYEVWGEHARAHG